MSKFGDKIRKQKEKLNLKKVERKKKRIEKGKTVLSKADRKNIKTNRKSIRKHTKKTTGKTGVEQSVDRFKKKVSGKVAKVAKTKGGKILKGAIKLVTDTKNTNVYKVGKGVRDTFRQLKKGKFGKAIRTAVSTHKSLNRKKKEE